MIGVTGRVANRRVFVLFSVASMQCDMCVGIYGFALVR